MHAAGQPGETHLVERMDELQARVQHLEDLLLDTEPTEIIEDATAVEAVEAPTPETQAPLEWVPAQETEPSSAPTAGSSLDEEPQTRTVHATPSEPVPVGRVAGIVQPTDAGIDLAYIEERLAGRALALVGGAALILGAVFFLSLAFSRGWIGPSMQVAMGSIGGTIGLLIGGFLLVRGDRVVGHVLSAVGLAVISMSLFAATNLYELIDPVIGLAAILAVAAITTAIAVVARSQVVAGFGLIAVLAAPPVLGASMDQLTLGYMIIVLGGVAAVSLWQTWSWLPPLAFLISAPQVFLWVLSDPSTELVFLALLGYWLLLAISAGGESFRRARPELSLASAPLFLAAGAFVLLSAFAVLTETHQQVAFLLTLAAFHAAVAAWFLVRRGPVDPFGLLAGAFGIAIASMAVPLLFGASMTAAVWAAEAAALAIIAGRYAHGPGLLGSLALLGVAGFRLVALAADTTSAAVTTTMPLVGPLDSLVVGWAFFLLAAAVCAVAVPSRTVRLTIASIATLVTVPFIYRELDGLAMVVASAVLALATLAAPRWLSLLGERPIEWRLGPALEWIDPERSLLEEATLLTRLVASVAAGLALFGAISLTAEQGGAPPTPFSDPAGMSALVLAAGCVLAGIILGGQAQRRLGVIAAIAVLGVAAFFQLPPAPLVVFWSGLAAIAFGLGRLDRRGLVSFVAAGSATVAVAAVAALVLAPPDRLFVSLGGVPPHPLLISEATMVLGAVALTLVFAARVHARARWSDWALAGAGVVTLYLLSIAVVDVFAAEAHGLSWRAREQVDALAKEAHVALSILWSVTGVLVTGAGLVLRNAALRVAGLAVLALAAAKVFLFDLSSLDIAYRVITLIVLGVLLMASAWAWNRLRPGATEQAAGDAHGRA